MHLCRSRIEIRRGYLILVLRLGFLQRIDERFTREVHMYG